MIGFSQQIETLSGDRCRERTRHRRYDVCEVPDAPVDPRNFRSECRGGVEEGGPGYGAGKKDRVLIGAEVGLDSHGSDRQREPAESKALRRAGDRLLDLVEAFTVWETVVTEKANP